VDQINSYFLNMRHNEKYILLLLILLSTSFIQAQSTPVNKWKNELSTSINFLTKKYGGRQQKIKILNRKLSDFSYYGCKSGILTLVDSVYYVNFLDKGCSRKRDCYKFIKITIYETSDTIKVHKLKAQIDTVRKLVNDNACGDVTEHSFIYDYFIFNNCLMTVDNVGYPIDFYKEKILPDLYRSLNIVSQY
jgi:hypothetical protein